MSLEITLDGSDSGGKDAFKLISLVVPLLPPHSSHIGVTPDVPRHLESAFEVSSKIAETTKKLIFRFLHLLEHGVVYRRLR